MLRHTRLLAPDTGGNPSGGAPPAGGTSETPPPQAGDTTPSTPPAGDDTTTISLDEARKLRSEAANLRKRLKAFEDAESQRQQSQLSEQEKLQKQLADLQAQREADVERLLIADIRLQAAELGVQPQYLKRLAGMLDWDDLQTDEQGNPTNLKELIGVVLKEMPFLTGRGGMPPQQQQASGATNPARSTTGQFSAITQDNLSEAMKNYNNLPESQKREVQRLLTRSI